MKYKLKNSQMMQLIQKSNKYVEDIRRELVEIEGHFNEREKKTKMSIIESVSQKTIQHLFVIFTIS